MVHKYKISYSTLANYKVRGHPGNIELQFIYCGAIALLLPFWQIYTTDSLGMARASCLRDHDLKISWWRCADACGAVNHIYIRDIIYTWTETLWI
jgi:hypothetical protein